MAQRFRRSTDIFETFDTLKIVRPRNVKNMIRLVAFDWSNENFLRVKQSANWHVHRVQSLGDSVTNSEA